MGAMLRPGYRDDPDEADDMKMPFSEEDWGLYGWADCWRLLTHKLENELDGLPEFAQIRAEAAAFASFESSNYAESEATSEQLANHTIGLRSGNRAGKPAQNKKGL
jgi:hypothetical protein